MKTKGDDNAFACQYSSQLHAEQGLTKREYFAAAALNGTLASTSDAADWPDPDFVAEQSLKYADALIEQLNKGRIG